MQGFDVNRFMRERAPIWEELEQMLARIDTGGGLKALGLDGARQFGKLYRIVSSDLIRARTEMVDASVVDYLNDLVARAYAQIYSGSGSRGRRIGRFFLRDFPRLFRKEWRPIALSAAIMLSGGVVGAIGVAVDPSSLGVLIPDQHQAFTPEERVSEEEETGGLRDAHSSVAFSSFLFTHNIRVTFMVFALGITAGIGTVAVLFANGVPLGALAVQYHQAGQGLFFWAWILPHGIPELTVIFIAGGAGLILARGILMPGRRRRRDAVVMEARTASKLIVGGMPLLVLAGLIEGTISQMHEPAVPYAVKLGVALLVGVAVYGYLFFAGRGAEEPDPSVPGSEVV